MARLPRYDSVAGIGWSSPSRLTPPLQLARTGTCGFSNAAGRPAERRQSQTEFRQARMVHWAWLIAIPEEHALPFLNPHIVDAGVPVCHQTVLVV